MSLPWERFQPDEVYEPPTGAVGAPPSPPVYHPDSPAPPQNVPTTPTISDFDLGQIIKEAVKEAVQESTPVLKENVKDYARDTIDTIRSGEAVDVFNPTITTTTPQGKELIIADAKSRSWRTLWQGLIVDVLAAILAVLATLTGMDPLVKETWILIAALLIKSVLSAIISYFMRLKITPTTRERGEKMAIMPLQMPVMEKDRDHDRTTSSSRSTRAA